ncbi:MAG: chromosomal replication initiator protein DnaA [Candidatus Absconditabacterales bacterium]
MNIDSINQYTSEKKTFFREIWEKIILYLSTQHDHKKIISFLNKTGIVDIDEGEKNIYIGVPNEFILTQVKKFFAKPLKDAVNETYNPQFNIKFIIYSGFSSNGSDLLINMKKILNIKETKKIENYEIKKSMKNDLTDYFGILFDQSFRFDTFVSGENTRMAFASAKAVAENPGQVYNPLFLYGNVGLGKTHLMQAIGNQIMQENPEKVVLYLPTSKLVDEIITAVRSNKMSIFLQKIENVDVLLIDDVQFLANKERTQEIFHNIFNDFQMGKKQIILSSDRPPKELVNIEPRLKSRFSLGLVTDIQAPDFETRIAILQSKMLAKSENFDFEFLEIIAKNIKNNVRELEGALNILITRKKVLNKEISKEDVFACLKTLGYCTENKSEITETAIQSNTKSEQNFANLVEMVSKYYNISVSDIKSELKKKEVTNARQILMLLAKKYFDRTLEKVGNYFGGKGHATVIYAINNIESKLKTDSNMAHDMQIFVERLKK